MPHVERAEVLASSTAAMLAGVRADLVVLDCPPEVRAEGVAMLRRIDSLIGMLQRVPALRDRT